MMDHGDSLWSRRTESIRATTFSAVAGRSKCFGILAIVGDQSHGTGSRREPSADMQALTLGRFVCQLGCRACEGSKEEATQRHLE